METCTVATAIRLYQRLDSTQGYRLVRVKYSRNGSPVADPHATAFYLRYRKNGKRHCPSTLFNTFLKVIVFLNDRGIEEFANRGNWIKPKDWFVNVDKRNKNKKYPIYNEDEFVAMLSVADATESALPENSHTRVKSARSPGRGGFHLYKRANEPTILSDDELKRAYEALPTEQRNPWELHTRGTYAIAEERRRHRHAHVINNWDERDRQTLFMLALGWTHTEIGEILKISRQAVTNRVRDMLNNTGMETDTQLVLWFLGFISLRPNDSKTVPGTTLIESCEAGAEVRKLLYRRYHRHVL
jgi:DNA-binding CsgD family transcriptional regulator